MNCKKIEHKLIFYVEDNLPDEERQTIERHLQTCSSCREKVKILQQTFDFIKTEKQTEVNPFISTRVIANISDLENRSIFDRFLKPAFVTFLLFLALAIGNFVGNYYNSIQKQQYFTNAEQNTDSLINYANNNIVYDDYYFINSQ